MVEKMTVTFELNGKPTTVKDYPMARLLDVLREKVRCTGPKEGCGEGECGACAIMYNGQLVNSCLVPVAQAHGATIQTVEGIAQSEKWKVVPEKFVECNGAQCGICTPGMVMASVNLLQQNSQPSREEIQTALAGNLCRCTGYMKIYDAVELASQALRGQS